MLRSLVEPFGPRLRPREERTSAKGERYSVEIDPAVLIRFANAAQGVSETLATLDVLGPFWTAHGALPGTEMSILAVDASRLTSAVLTGMADRMKVIAQSARGASEDYRVTEEDFAAELRAMRVTA